MNIITKLKKICPRTSSLKTKTVQACILDWSGTVCDKYTISPAISFKNTFEKHGIEVNMNQCRKPMGQRKDVHIREMLFNDPDIHMQWKSLYKSEPTNEDVTRLYSSFVSLQKKNLISHSTILPGVAAAIKTLQQSGIKIGSTTGFTREFIDILLSESKKQGVHLDCTVGGDEVINGSRPSPHMLYRNLDVLNIDDISTVVKVDDTVSGIHEGLNAGCWTVGVSRYSNDMHIDSIKHEDELNETEIIERNIRVQKQLKDAGAHFVIDSVAELPEVVQEINAKLKKNLSATSEIYPIYQVI